MRDNKFHIGRTMKDFKRYKLAMVKEIAVIAVRFFKVDVFEAQGFINNGVQRWAPTKKKSSGKTLVKSGRGRASITETKVTTRGAKIIAQAPYMYWHNEGGKHLPQRRFMGDSAELDRKALAGINKFMKRL